MSLPKQHPTWNEKKKGLWPRRNELDDVQFLMHFKDRDPKIEEVLEESLMMKKRIRLNPEESRALFHGVRDRRLLLPQNRDREISSNLCVEFSLEQPRLVGCQVKNILSALKKGSFIHIHEDLRADFKRIYDNSHPLAPQIVPPPPPTSSSASQQSRNSGRASEAEREILIQMKKKELEEYRMKLKHKKEKLVMVEEKASLYQKRVDDLEEEIESLTGKKRKRRHDEDDEEDDEKLTPRKRRKRK